MGSKDTWGLRYDETSDQWKFDEDDKSSDLYPCDKNFL